MTGLRLCLFCAVMLLSAGCSPAPVAVTAPESGTLQALVDQKVTLEGKVELHKAGLVLQTSGPPVILEYRGSQDASWPDVGTRVQVTGVLRAGGSEYPFHLEHPRSTKLENSAR